MFKSSIRNLRKQGFMLSYTASILTILTLSPLHSASAEETNFSRDVASSIDNGLVWFDNLGVYSNPASFGGNNSKALGLAALALMERRSSADQNAAPTGYVNATPADQAKIQTVMSYIINRATTASFQSYRDGSDLMAISLYLRSGGPSSQAGLTAVRAIFDRIRTNQSNVGYWAYTGPGDDSSTTQLVMAGLAGARGVFSDPLFSDPVRLAQLDEVTQRTANAYATNGRRGELANDGKGHGYNTGSSPSYQQTASGLWSQIIGGYDLHSASVQDYLNWLYLRYNYQTINAYRNSWNQTYFYYLWSSAKAFTFIEDSGLQPLVGQISTADLGTLQSNQAPTQAARLLLRDPNTDPRVATRGAGAAGYYSSIYELPRWYYDYAYTIMGTQDPTGFFDSPHGSWNTIASQAYALLVLERSVGGGCIDSDNDEICDAEDNCPALPNPDQLDADDDGYGDICDICPNAADPNQLDGDGDGTGDACDVCPNLPNPAQRDGDRDGYGDLCDICPNVADPNQLDSDRDSLGDACDNCPNTSNQGQSDRDNDSHGDLCDLCPDDFDNQTDLDSDGVGDACDSCLFDPNPDQEDLDQDGIGDACDNCISDSGPEICDGLDNDCDNIVDEDPILSPTCEVPGGGECSQGVPSCIDGAVICEPSTSAQDEICDGIDNDCDQRIDEDASDANRDCYTDLPGACTRGTSRCEGGEIICDGFEGPAEETCDLQDQDCDGVIDEGTRNACGFCGAAEAELCDGVDQDCDGMTDEGAMCPDGLSCRSGACVEACVSNECFSDTVCVDGFCISPCANVECPAGEQCEDGTCFDPCDGVNCTEGERCYEGECLMDSCTEVPCPEGSRCGPDGCEADPCSDVECAEGQFCREGSCINSCGVISCPGGEQCEDGICLPNLCTNIACPAGEECISGTCEPARCEGITCDAGYICVSGDCLFDPCGSVECPSGEACRVDENGEAQCFPGWIEMSEDGEPIEPPVAGEIANAEGGTTGGSDGMAAGQDFVQDPTLEGGEEDMGSIGSAESVSGCEQRDPRGATLWLLFLLIGVFIRRATSVCDLSGESTHT